MESKSSKVESDDKKPAKENALQKIASKTKLEKIKEKTIANKKIDEEDQSEEEQKIASTTITPSTTTEPSTTPKPNKNYNINTSESSKIYSQNSPNQKQHAAVPPSIKHRLTQTQNGKSETYPKAVTEKSPESALKKIEEKKYSTRFLPSKHLANNVDEKTKADKTSGQPASPDSYVTVTKSVTGSLDNTKTPAEDNKNFESTYYTKSSTCGYFTFSCNVVYGANGRSKICRPKTPTNGKC